MRRAAAAIEAERRLAVLMTGQPPRGKRDAVLTLLRVFCEIVDRGEPVPLPLLKILRARFGTYLADQSRSLDSIFGVARLAGRPFDKKRSARDLNIYRRVLELRGHGFSTKKSVSTVAQEFGKSFRYVEAVLEKHRDQLMREGKLNSPSGRRRAVAMLFPAERGEVKKRAPPKERAPLNRK